MYLYVGGAIAALIVHHLHLYDHKKKNSNDENALKVITYAIDHSNNNNNVNPINNNVDNSNDDKINHKVLQYVPSTTNNNNSNNNNINNNSEIPLEITKLKNDSGLELESYRIDNNNNNYNNDNKDVDD